jgi:hypothetical protein
MVKADLYKFVQQCMLEYPSKKEIIKDIYYLALSEIEEGGSEMHECQLAINDIQEIIASD